MSEPLRRALDMHETEPWRNADILVVSDGAFAVPEEIKVRIEEEQAASDLDVHGLLLGEADFAMRELCTQVHRLRDWVNHERS